MNMNKKRDERLRIASEQAAGLVAGGAWGTGTLKGSPNYEYQKIRLIETAIDHADELIRQADLVQEVPEEDYRCAGCGASTCSIEEAATWIKDGGERICRTCGEKRIAMLRKRIERAYGELTAVVAEHSRFPWAQVYRARRILRGEESSDG